MHETILKHGGLQLFCEWREILLRSPDVAHISRDKIYCVHDFTADVIRNIPEGWSECALARASQ